MEEIGLVHKKAYVKRPIRFEYGFTEKGLGLLSVLQEVSRWANRFMPETWTPLDEFMTRQVS